MSEAQSWGYDELVDLARNKSKAGRAQLITAITDLYTGTNRRLTASDRAQMSNIIRSLIHEVEVSVRRALAEHLSANEAVPKDLLLTLANEHIDVAFPILVNCQALTDPDLIEVIQYRTMEHQLAIAMRPRLSEEVSHALVETGNEEVIVTLLDNETASIADHTLERLVDESGHIERFHEPLARRYDLPRHMVKKLYWLVSAALREHLVRQFDIDPNTLDDTIDDAVHGILDGNTTAHRAPPAPADSDLLMRYLNTGKIPLFVDLFGTMTGLPSHLVRRLLFEPGGEGLAMACRAVGLDKHTFASIFLKVRQGRLGDHQVNPDEVRNAVDFFGQLTQAPAQKVLSRWRKDPEYLNTLRLIEETWVDAES